ncbi:MAG: peptidylprolyl isomerase [Methylococcales bacterium]|nr:peptidylprolyl isomerase [Methylococcales bacterium]MDD5755034.1 peptidylprolyl isomerase [Methylococcales bacterium]
MKLKLLSLMVAGLAITGCDQKPANTTTTPTSTPVAAVTPVTVNKADAVAVVNGQYIAKAALDELEKEIATRSHGQTFPKEKLVDELIQRELLIQDATKKNLDQTPEFVARLTDARKALLSQTDLQNFIAANPVTDAEIKAEYDSKVAAEKGTEYKARHILVKTEAEAKKVIADLDKGGDFKKLADKLSLDGKEAQNGGDLGWFSAAQMVAPFSDAVAALENGKYTKTPVQTQFGFHVIMREESRPQTPPPLDAVKEQLTPFLQRQKIETMLKSLRTAAKVEVLIPLTEEKPKVEAPAVVPATVESVQPTAAEPAVAPAEPAK